MDKWTFVLVVAVATVTLVSAQTNSTDSSPASPPTTNSMFGDLPKGDYNSSSINSDATDGLKSLFDMAKGFVNVVFEPFSKLATFLTAMFESPDAWQYFIDNWQEAAKFEAGYIACLVFGLLFVIFVPLVGSIVCCCRCCCNNCGGRFEQSMKRSKSCWRQCLCVSMLVLTVLMTVPTVFVFLTNQWITEVVDSGPTKIVTALDDINEYANLVPKQINYIADEYMVVDNNVRPLVSDFGVSLGVPLQQFVNDSAQPSLSAMDDAIKVVDDTVAAIDAANSSLTALETGMVTLSANLSDLQSEMSTGLAGSPCSADAACVSVRESTDQLAVGFDVTKLAPLHDELQDVENSLTSYDVKGLRSDIDQEINDIPQKVTDETKDASSTAVNALDSAKSAVDDVTSSIPNSFENFDQTIGNVTKALQDAITWYDDNADQYRYIAGVVLGSMLAFIVGCYYLGMLLGICGNDRKVSPSERGCTSSCGGVWLMIGVAFSFIFSWLLMILVIVLFTVGGHGERYGCQGLEGPNYEALGLVEDVTGFNLSSTLNLPEGETLTLADLLNSCKDDESAYNALKLEYVYNVTAYLANVTSTMTDLQTEVNDAVNAVDISTIEVYTKQNQEDLLALKNSGIESVNFTGYLDDLGTGVTQTNLTDYAAFLRNATTAIGDPTLSSLINGYADRVDEIQQDEVVPLQVQYDTLTDSINTLIAESQQINETIDALDTALVGLNQTIQQDGKAEVQSVADSLYDQVSGNITAFVDWAGKQVTDTMGACRPVYDSYTATVGVFCDYFIDTINGLWFSLGWAIFFLIPSAIVAMKLMKFFRRMTYVDEFDDSWNDMEMNDMAMGTPGNKANGGYY